MTLRKICLAAVACAVLCGCAGEPPDLSKSGRAAEATVSAAPAPVPVSPEPPPQPADDLVPGEIPAELTVTIRSASAALQQQNDREALGLLVDVTQVEQSGGDLQKMAESFPRLNAVLLQGTLDHLLTLKPLVAAAGDRVLFEVSDVTHVRFSRIGGHWRLSDFRGLDPQTPGLGYDNAAAHAAFLTRHLLDQPARPWMPGQLPAAEDEAVQRLVAAGAGVALAGDGAPDAAVVIVLNREFTGGAEAAALLSSVPGLRLLALYDTSELDAIVGGLPAVPGLTHLRVQRETLTDAVLTALARLPQLTSLSLTCRERRLAEIAQLKSLRELQTLELISVGFWPDDLQALAALPKLRRLDLTSSSLDDSGLAALAEFPALESLRVSAQEITADGVLKLKQAKPGLHVDW